jgi:tetratricopeptide (TPR) repeat protein
MRLILVIAAALLLCTCHPSGNQTKSVSRQNSQPPPDVLSEADFYQIDSVMACQHRSGLVGALQGKKLFLKAIDLYRNQKNPEASIDLFHKSIRIWPDAKSYYELGDALIDLKDYQQSLHAFKVALNLQFEPLPNLYYNMACAHAMLHDTLEAVNYLQDALRNGYSNQKQVLSDTDLDAIRNTPGYRSAVLEHFKGNLTMRQLQFRSFLSSFPELTLPMNISKDSVGKYNLAKAIIYDFREWKTRNSAGG